jgi:hypothetical protein
VHNRDVGPRVLNKLVARCERRCAVVGRQRCDELLLQVWVGLAGVELLVELHVLGTHCTKAVRVERLLHQLRALVGAQLAIVVDALACEHDVPQQGVVHYGVHDLQEQWKMEKK